MLPFNHTATWWHLFVDNHRHRRVLAGILSSAQLTNSGVGGLCSSSDSPHSGDFRLESRPSDLQNAATAWLMYGDVTTLRRLFAFLKVGECIRDVTPLEKCRMKGSYTQTLRANGV